MRKMVGLALALALIPLPGSARAEDKKPKQAAPAKEVKPEPTKKVVPGKAFWKILVKPKAKWVLRSNETTDKIAVETYDVRKVGAADVARIRWAIDRDGSKEDIGATEHGKFTQVAVTDKGLYLLNAGNDDAAVAKRLEGAPSRSSPPRPYKSTRANLGRYLTIDDDGIVCMGQGPVDTSEVCEDTCDAEVCVSATKGVVSLSGTWAPDFWLYRQ